MNKSVYVWIACFLGLLQVSCGGGGGSESGNGSVAVSSQADPIQPDPIQADPIVAPILGRWVQPCGGASPIVSQRRSVEYYADGTFEDKITLYADNVCTESQRTLRVLQNGRFRSEPSSLSVEGTSIHDLDYMADFTSAVALSQIAADDLNAQGGTCGRDNWEAGVSYDVSDCQLGRIGARATPYTDYLIYTVQDGKLILGSELSFTPESRATQLSEFAEYIRPEGATGGDNFPAGFEGFWSLRNRGFYLQLGSAGRLTLYFPTTAPGCFEAVIFSMSDLGASLYQTEFGNAFQITQMSDTLSISFLADGNFVNFTRETSVQPDALTICELDF